MYRANYLCPPVASSDFVTEIGLLPHNGVTTLGGLCELELYRSDDQMTLLMAGEGHAAYIKSPFVPKENNNHYVANMKPFDGSWGHSILFIGSTGYIPGIDGRLNPHKGLYVYGDNLSINGTVAKPAAHFKLDEWLEVRDSKGMECSMRFKVVEGNFSLLEYTTPQTYADVNVQDSHVSHSG